MKYLTKFNLSPAALSFIKLGLEKNESKRGSAKQMLEHEWIKDVPNILIDRVKYPQNLKQGLILIKAGQMVDVETLKAISQQVMTKSDW